MMGVNETLSSYLSHNDAAMKMRRDPLKRHLPVETAANPVSIAT